MNTNQDIRWEQRFKNFLKAYALLTESVQLSAERELSSLEKEGVIQRFEFTHELAWNVLKDYFEYQGNTSITGARDATREAFKAGLISDAEDWMEMIKSRNKTSHTYNESVADSIYEQIISTYHPSFSVFRQKMNQLIGK